MKRLAISLLALSACTPAMAANSQPTPVPTTAVTVESVAPELPSVVVTSSDPSTCITGGEFVRVTPDAFVCGRNGPELYTLFPVTNKQLVELVMGPYADEFITKIIPRETGETWIPDGWQQDPASEPQPASRDWKNDYGCIGWTQLCSKQAYAAKLGYTWEEARYAYPNLLIARMLVDEAVAAGKDPYSDWRCSRCSLRRR